VPRRAYHDKQWAAKMKAIGLPPTNTGKRGGKETGQSMTHLINPKGAYACAYQKLAATGWLLNWQSSQGDVVERKKKQASKTRYTCPACGVNAWAKPDTQLICGECYEQGEEPLVMEAA
jgi:hypothetical protein